MRPRPWIVMLAFLATMSVAPRAAAQSEPPQGAWSEGDKVTEVRQLATQERLQRLRTARIERLRQLAAAKGQTERIAALDKLSAKQSQLYERRVARIRERLGDAEFKAAQQRVRNARIESARTQDRERNARELQQEREKRDREEKARKKDAREKAAREGAGTRPAPRSNRPGK